MVDRHLRGLSDRTPNIFEDEFHEDDDHDFTDQNQNHKFIDDNYREENQQNQSVEERFIPSFDKSEPHEIAAFMVSASNQDDDCDDHHQELTDFNIGATDDCEDFMRPSLMTVDLDYNN